MKTRVHIILFALSSLLLMTVAGCSEYNKVLKSTDIEYKYTKAIEYFEDESYYKALPIL